MSFAIGLGCIGIARQLGWSLTNGEASAIGSMLGWLGSINVLLAAFNLIPGYSLDGGRVLRAVLWKISKDQDRATQTAARVGQAVAAILMGWGVLQFVIGAGFGGLWLALIGWFLFTAAQASYAEVSIVGALRNIKVADVMTDECVSVDPGLSVQHWVDTVLLRTGRPCIFVARDGQIVGVVTPRDVARTDRAQWHTLSVSDVMRPLEAIATVEPTTSVSDALKSMVREETNQLPGVSDKRVKGVVNRARIFELLQLRTELLRGRSDRRAGWWPMGATMTRCAVPQSRGPRLTSPSPHNPALTV